MTLIDLSSLQTEGLNPATEEIDQVSTVELCRLINDEDATVAAAVAKCIPAIANAIDALADKVRLGGRVIYVGAGTSGRLGVVDASEIPPTYSAPHGQFVALMAGGDDAMRIAQEGAEDSLEGAVRDLENVRLDPRLDSVIGIAASGRTPYVLGCLEYAKKLGCVTVAVACSHPSVLSASGVVDHMISPVTGPEAVTGSTRMKAGTATKLALNMLSTGVMIKIGKTYGNMMVDLKASNEKLKVRSRNIIRKLGGQLCPSTDEEIDELLAKCDGSVKLSLATLAVKSTPEDARQRLEAAGGKLSTVLQSASEEAAIHSQSANESSMKDDQSFVMYIDGGGTKCAAVVMSTNGEVGEGEAGPCNVTDIGLEASIASIKLAAQRALAMLSKSSDRSPQLDIQSANFPAIWVGLAGYDRSGAASRIQPALSKLFNVSSSSSALHISNDIDVLATAGEKTKSKEHAIVLIAGTGSVAMRYARDLTQPRERPPFTRTGRSGGWGHLLGDDGGGFDLGRQAIRATLSALDALRIAHPESSEISAQAIEQLPPLSQKILTHFNVTAGTNYDLLSSILVSSSNSADEEATNPKSRIAHVARLVLEAYNKNNSTSERNTQASIEEETVTTGVNGLIRTLIPLLTSPSPVDTSSSTLVLSGSLLTSNNDSNNGYRSALLAALEEKGFKFGDVQMVKSPARLGAEGLSARCFE